MTTSAPSERIDIGALVVARLRSEGVEVIFTVPGEQLDPIFRALAQSGIRVVHTRHEQAAALMAFGYARTTGRTGVFVVISGPGVLNSVTGLATAYAGDARVLCIAGQIATPLVDRGLGIPHEIPDQLGMLERVTGWTARVESADTAIATLDEAFRRLADDRPRPIALEIPTDVLVAQVSTPAERRPTSTTLRTIDHAQVSAARELLADAQRPVIFVGSGARAATDEVRQLAALLLAPVTTELGGRGVVSDLDALSIPLAVAHDVWAEADVVLAVGTRLLRPQVEWGTDGLRVVRVDLDPVEIHRVATPEVALVGDAAELLGAVLDGMDPVAEREEWWQRIDRARRAVDERQSVIEPQVHWVRAIREALPDDGFFVDEMTQVGYAARLALPVLEPSTYVLPTYVGALGFGFATALGVKVAHPDRAVVSISGDGGFTYTLPELATAVQHGIGVVAVVFNDQCYSNVARSQEKFLAQTIGTDLHNPDFVALAESFGAVGVLARTPEELRSEIEKALVRDDIPTVIEVPVGAMPNVWQLIRLPRVR